MLDIHRGWPLTQVASANAARVKAQQEAHELRLKQRPADGEFTNDGAVKEYTPFRPVVHPHGRNFVNVPTSILWYFLPVRESAIVPTQHTACNYLPD